MIGFYSNVFTTDSNSSHSGDYILYEEDSSVILKVLAPEILKKDIDIDVDNKFVLIKSNKEDLSNKTFQRTLNYKFRLLKPVDKDKITANLKNGVLTLHMPIQKSSLTKKISIT
jgi:HSP20 family molecular chaperone IbpA